MASDFVPIGVIDGPTSNVTEWSTHLSFTGRQVVDRLLLVFHKEDDPDFFCAISQARTPLSPS